MQTSANKNMKPLYWFKYVIAVVVSYDPIMGTLHMSNSVARKT